MKPKGKPVKWSDKIAYAVGLITTDGNLSSNGKILSLVSKDLSQIETFRKCLGLKNKIGLTRSGCARRKDYYRVQFGNVILYKWLLDLGLMPNKSKRIGTLRIPNKYFFNFLRGHLDGDGHIRRFQDPVYPNSQRLYTVFHSASLVHLKWLQQRIASLLNIRGFIERTTRQFRLTFAKRDSLKLLPKIYPNPKVPHLSRKYKIIKNLLKR
ncbi:MAG: hypothetical protein KJI70_02335 [Patescibacteria group bacterium]|nr:hypothetical protein [Patescibacteria group bacterium]